MRSISRTVLAGIFLLIGLSIGFQTGRSSGFETGSEWALMQADILAREAGVHMPVVLDDDTFRVVMKQPRGLYKRAWKRADEYDQNRAARNGTTKF